jgi:hypothetical protein
LVSDLKPRSKRNTFNSRELSLPYEIANFPKINSQGLGNSWPVLDFRFSLGIRTMAFREAGLLQYGKPICCINKALSLS